MLRKILRVLLTIALLGDLLMVFGGLMMVAAPPAGQTRGEQVPALLFLVFVGLALFFGIGATFTKEEREKNRQMAEERKRMKQGLFGPATPTPEPQSPVAPAPRPYAPDAAGTAVPSGPLVIPAPDPVPVPTPTPVPSPQWTFAPAAPAGRRGHLEGRNWVPPLPGPNALDPWGRCEDAIDVVGENYRKGVFAKIMGREPGFRAESGAVINDPAILVFDGSNPYSKSHLAIAVYVRGAHVGYIPEDLARVWGVVLRDLAAEGFDLKVKARTWAKMNGYGEHAAVTVHLPAADALRPSNGLPAAPHVIIPAGKKRQVSGEENHMDALAPFIIPGGVNHVSVVLRSVTEVRPRSTAELVQVELGGKRVGRLTDLQSKNLLPLVKYIEARGKLPVARADVIGTALKADVIVMTADASEVSHEWLESLGPEIPTPTEVLPGPDWDWDDDPETPDEAVLRVRRERERCENGVHEHDRVGVSEEPQE